jgi:ADP-heptose:LPS heptosyltransferase
LTQWPTKGMLSIASKMFARKNIDRPFSLSELSRSTRRVLAVPPVGLAEMLLLYPALTLMRKALPNARIICVAEGSQAELLRGEALVDDFVQFPELKGTRGVLTYRSFVADIRDRAVEAAFYFDFRYDFYRQFLPLLAGARLRAKLRGDAGYPLFNVEVVPKDEEAYFLDLNLSLVRFLTSYEDEPSYWRLPAKEIEIAREIIRFRKPDPTEMLVGVDLSITKADGPPPFDVQVRLARSFAALKPSRIALLSDPNPAIKDDEIARFGDYEWLDIPRKSFRDTLGILSQCDLFITANTTLFHFAVAMGVPAFALFSAKDDLRWIPGTGAFELVDEDKWSQTPPAKLAMQMRDFVMSAAKV